MANQQKILARVSKIAAGQQLQVQELLAQQEELLEGTEEGAAELEVVQQLPKKLKHEEAQPPAAAAQPPAAPEEWNWKLKTMKEMAGHMKKSGDKLQYIENRLMENSLDYVENERLYQQLKDDYAKSLKEGRAEDRTLQGLFENLGRECPGVQKDLEYLQQFCEDYRDLKQKMDAANLQRDRIRLQHTFWWSCISRPHLCAEFCADQLQLLETFCDDWEPLQKLVERKMLELGKKKKLRLGLQEVLAEKLNLQTGDLEFWYFLGALQAKYYNYA